MTKRKEYHVYYHGAKETAARGDGWFLLFKGIGWMLIGELWLAFAIGRIFYEVFATPFRMAGIHIFNVDESTSLVSVDSSTPAVKPATNPHVFNINDRSRLMMECINGKYGPEAKQKAMLGELPKFDQYTKELLREKQETDTRVENLAMQEKLRAEIEKLQKQEAELASKIVS